MVNGIMASCYAISNHDLAHLILAPMQWHPDIMVWIFFIEKESPCYISIYIVVALQLIKHKIIINKVKYVHAFRNVIKIYIFY